MSLVRGRDTTPEKKVRSLLHRMGYRFRLHARNLPGNPDIVLPGHKKIIFVHGCFWHQHEGCRRSTRPTSNVEFWDKKLNATVERDKRNLSALRAEGWRVNVIWECETKNIEKLLKKIKDFMES